MSGAPTGGGKLLLGLDTATDHLALSLVEAPVERGGHVGGAEVARFVEQVGREHSARLLAELDALLRRSGAAREDVVGIGVGVGPGSYTGVRIGVSSARALGRAWGVPVGGSSSLLALLDPEIEPGARGVALLDARKGNVYAQVGRRLDGPEPTFEPVGDPVKLPRSEVETRFPGLPVSEGPPSAAVLARRALLGGSLEPWYL